MKQSKSTNLRIQILAPFIILILIIACRKRHDDSLSAASTSICSGPAKSFSNDVNPIFQSTCASVAGCHGNGSINGPGALTSYSKIFNARADIRSEVASGEMPLNSSLSTTEKNAILCWIDNGAPNN